MNANLAGIIAILLWSISPLLIIGAGTTPPFLLGFLTLSAATITLFIKYLAFDRLSIKELFNHSTLAYLITTYGIAGYMCFWLLAFEHAPAFEANTLNYLWPILLVGFSMALKRISFSFLKIFGLCLAFVGVALIFANKQDASLQIDYSYGYIFAIIAAFIWASFSIATYSVKFPGYAMAAFMIIPALICLALHLTLEAAYTPSWYEIIFILALGLTRISFSFWDYAMKHANITLIGSLSYFIPVISTGLLILFNHTPRNDMILLSALLVLAGCLIVNYKSLDKK